jgi:hypothetical protein
MNLRTLFLAAPLAVVLACGGSTSTGTGSASLNAATPSFAALSLDQVKADAVAPATVLDAPLDSTLMAGPGGGCHPHLFMREREVVERVNRHIYKVLGKVEKLIAANPLTETASFKTWAKTEGGVDTSFTIKLVAANVYSWEFDAGPTGTTPLPVVMTGEIDRSTATGDHDGKGTMEVDFAKLAAAFPHEHVSGGTLQVQFDVSASSRKITVVADQVTWQLDPAHFEGGAIPTGLTQARSGAYTYFRESGKGGSLKIQDEMSFACGMDPRVANAALVPANAQMISRWFKAADGSVHGRSDGLITGGQLTGSAIASIVGVTCHDASAEQHMAAEGFWLMKAEGPTGATVVGFSSTSLSDPSATAAPCDPLLGDVPLLADSTKDFTGWPPVDPAHSINPFYSDNSPFPFPGM